MLVNVLQKKLNAARVGLRLGLLLGRQVSLLLRLHASLQLFRPRGLLGTQGLDRLQTRRHFRVRTRALFKKVVNPPSCVECCSLLSGLGPPWDLYFNCAFWQPPLEMLVNVLQKKLNAACVLGRMTGPQLVSHRLCKRPPVRLAHSAHDIVCSDDSRIVDRC